MPTQFASSCPLLTYYNCIPRLDVALTISPASRAFVCLLEPVQDGCWQQQPPPQELVYSTAVSAEADAQPPGGTLTSWLSSWNRSSNASVARAPLLSAVTSPDGSLLLLLHTGGLAAVVNVLPSGEAALLLQVDALHRLAKLVVEDEHESVGANSSQLGAVVDARFVSPDTFAAVDACGCMALFKVQSTLDCPILCLSIYLLRCYHMSIVNVPLRRPVSRNGLRLLCPPPLYPATHPSPYSLTHSLTHSLNVPTHFS